MTEKKQRFYLLSDKEDAIIFENGFGLSQQKACDLLNALHEENIMLKEEIKDFQDLLAGKEEELLKPILQMIDDHIAEYFKKQREAEQGKGWGNSTRYLCYQVALTHLKKELMENDWKQTIWSNGLFW